MKNEKQIGSILTVGPGVELNYGRWEDSDSVVTIRETELLVVGERTNGALAVKILGDENADGVIFFFHQPE